MKRPILETRVESKLVKYARGRGCIVVKFRDDKTNGAPDRLILTPYGVPVFIEVKRPGERPRPEQERYLERLVRAGYLAIWTDNAAQAARTLDAVIDHPQPAERARQLISRIICALDRVR